MLILRPVCRDDLGDLVELAGQLDSVNLPADADFLEQRIAASERSFSGQLDDWRAGLFVFALEDTSTGRCVGTSMIRAKDGTPETPYYWLDVSSEERASVEIGRRFIHKKLTLRSTTDGPTEIGGIVLDPDHRGHPEKCGKALSIVRFAYIAAHRDCFERELVAEMLSPFDAPGKNRLWDAFGKKFTGLTYRDADHRSARSKAFISDLFPRDPVYATLFPQQVQDVIGETNESSRAALRILEQVGFHSLNRVDPFDGGPYYGAARDAIVTVRERRELVLPGAPCEPAGSPTGTLALLSTESRLGFRATVLPLDEDGSPVVPKEHRELLGVAAGDRVSVSPLP